MNALERSFTLVKESLKVLRQDPELAVFPVISFVATMLAALTIGGVGFFAGLLDSDTPTSALNIAFLLAFYFCTYFITIYFQVALVACVQHRLAGGDPNLSFGINAANRRLGAIASWALIAAVVGLILRMLEEAARRNARGWGSIVAQIAIAIAGAAWSLATFFVIPILASEGIGGFAALRRSVGVVKQRWGEAVIGGAGIGLVMLIAGIAVAVVVGGPAFLALSAGGAIASFGLALAIITVVGVLTIVAVGATLQSIYTAVVYQYATAGKTLGGFTPALLEGAFQPDRGSQPRGFAG
ncbi:MAG: hypothetical protein HY681_05305 [Chloroflexi bacterium]|nr:hypothetical protein [Chloroflexota bacterium]